MMVGPWMSFLTMAGAIPAGALLLTRLPPDASLGQGTFNPSPKTAEEAVEQFVWANRILANEGIFDAFGHVSVRNPENDETFFIARAIAPEIVTKKDILELDQEGNVLTKTRGQACIRSGSSTQPSTRPGRMSARSSTRTLSRS